MIFRLGHSHTAEIEGQVISFEGAFQADDGQLARLLPGGNASRALVQAMPLRTYVENVGMGRPEGICTFFTFLA